MSSYPGQSRPVAHPATVPDPDRALVVRGLAKSFSVGFHVPGSSRARRTIRAVRDVSFDVAAGSVYVLIGANGSGKSTLIRTLSTLVLADAGEVRVFGLDVTRDSMAARRLINRVSADPSFFGQMTPLENLQFFGRVYGLPARSIRARASAILDRLGLGAEQQRAMVKTLSRGRSWCRPRC